MLNRIIIMGRLVRDPELRTTQSGAQRGIDDIHDFVISVNLCHGLHLLLDEWPPLSGGSKDMPAKRKPYYYTGRAGNDRGRSALYDRAQG